MLYSEERHDLDPSDPVDVAVINYGRAMTVGMSADELHVLRISLATDLHEHLTPEGHKALLELACAFDYLYHEKRKEANGDARKRTSEAHVS